MYRDTQQPAVRAYDVQRVSTSQPYNIGDRIQISRKTLTAPELDQTIHHCTETSPEIPTVTTAVLRASQKEESNGLDAWSVGKWVVLWIRKE